MTGVESDAALPCDPGAAELKDIPQDELVVTRSADNTRA
jgi:hypothetical protein